MHCDDHSYVVFDRALQGSKIKSHSKNFPKDKKRKRPERKLSRILPYLRNFQWWKASRLFLEEIPQANLSCISEWEDNEDCEPSTRLPLPTLSSWYNVIARFERYSKRKIMTTALKKTSQMAFWSKQNEHELGKVNKRCHFSRAL